ncbi:hypothetical protein BLNAU_15214 [Blattamonas nauphoetae]|uniref:Uncharacterized protein n=1 Tax=Blattamonas nauphoetae TaxID=2049346 RepID=A0ABQ9XDP6_9EUKA|nr:hypothetical protein BLNAU_15214 [Blattamonas nauphoetae]
MDFRQRARSTDKDRIVSLEDSLSIAQDEIRRLNDLVAQLRDVLGSVQTTTFAHASFVFTDPSHFLVDNGIITCTDAARGPLGRSLWSSLFLDSIFETGVISVEITILFLDNNYDGDLMFGLMDSNNHLLEICETFGGDAKTSTHL